MTMTEATAANVRASAIAAGQAAAAAGAHASMVAISAAAANAAKTGGASSELKATIAGILVAGVVAALNALAVMPGPWMLPAVALSAAIAAGSYAASRGKVKAAALQAAGAAAVALYPRQAVVIGDVGTLAAAALGARQEPPAAAP